MPRKTKLAEAITPAPAGDETNIAEAYQRLNAAQDNFLHSLGADTSRRSIISVVANIIIGGITSYVGVTLVNYMLVGAALLTGSAFVMFMLAFIGYALTILAAILAGSAAATFVTTFDRTVWSQRITNAQHWFQQRIRSFA